MIEIKNNGIQNEYDFVEMFNGKYLKELDSNSQKFLKELFNSEIISDEPIKSWKNKYMQKADIFVRYKNYIKSISLKCGNSNSIHHESIEDFKKYLEDLGIRYKIIDYYASYHYGYMRNENGEIDFSKSLSADEYKSYYQDEIDIFNKEINKTKIIVNMIDRFIIRGRNSDYDIDALVCGTTSEYLWILKYDLYVLILSNRCNDFSSPHIACLTIGPKKRNLERKSLYAKDRYVVCIRWNYIKESIEKFKNAKKI